MSPQITFENKISIVLGVVNRDMIHHRATFVA